MFLDFSDGVIRTKKILSIKINSWKSLLSYFVCVLLTSQTYKKMTTTNETLVIKFERYEFCENHGNTNE
jgi:hypothetical protein